MLPSLKERGAPNETPAVHICWRGDGQAVPRGRSSVAAPPCSLLVPSHIAISDGTRGEMEWRVDDGDDFVTVIDCPQSSDKSSVTGSVKTVVKDVDKKPDGTTNDHMLDLLAP